jgi:hypothetical protein
MTSDRCAANVSLGSAVALAPAFLDGGTAEPRRFSVRVAAGLEDLVARAWDDTFPVDCDEARERDGG